MPRPSTRIGILGALTVAALAILVARLWWLQLTRWSEHAAKALGNRTAIACTPAPRGWIYDRTGRILLARNREVWSAAVIPGQLPEDEAVMEKEVQFLASVLSTEESPMSLPEVREALMAAGEGSAAEPELLGDLGDDLSFDQVAAIEERRLEFPGLVVVTSTRRHYPYGALAAHAIGYTRPVSPEQLDRVGEYQYPPDAEDPTAAEVAPTTPDRIYAPDSIIGAEGAEEALELWDLEAAQSAPLPVLPGRRGRAIHEVDAAGIPQRLIAQRDPVPGALVHLTLDAQVQYVAEQALKEAVSRRPDGMGAAVVMDVRNGHVIVLASEPCLDPNDWVGGLTQEQWEDANEAGGLPFLNKALRAYPPGSIFKVVSTCAALETTNVRPTSTAYCTGKITVGRRYDTYRCWAADRGGHGRVDLYEAIAKSCNIFFYDCVLRFKLKPRDIASYARRFGLGETTGLGLRGEVAGRVPDPDSPDRSWRTGHSLQFVIGQDQLTVTPLQMSVACAAIANRGQLVTPKLVKRIRWPRYMHRKDTVNDLPDTRRFRVKPETIEIVRCGMRRAVVGERGTAAGLSGLGVSAAGKTGSAQLGGDEPTHAWVIAFAPYDDPQYAICVFVARGGTGGKVAVPIAARILRALFGKHDPDDPQFALPEPMGPKQVAHRRRQRIAAAKARADAREADRASEEPSAH